MTAPQARAAVAAAWCGGLALIAVSVLWGRGYQSDRPQIFLGAAPLVGRDFRDGWDWRFGWGLVGAGLEAVVVVVSVVRGWWWHARLRWIVAASSTGAGAFALLLALTDGADGVLYGAVHRTEYLSNLAIAPPAAEFVRTFVERIDDYSVHVRGHPPGFVLALKAMDDIGLGGEWPTALLSVVATIALPAALLVTLWSVVDADCVRRVAPLLIVAPYLLWMVTSADAVYTAVGAWGVAACAVGLRIRGRRAAVAWLVGGLSLGWLLFLTYSGAVFLLLPITIAAAVRRRGATGMGGIGATILGAVVVTAAFTAAGFWWFAGAAETRLQYWAGTAQFRTWTYFGLANLAVALIAMGPATFAGLLRLRDRRVWVVVAGGLLALLASHLSQYTRAEVERIWLPFYPWIAVAGGALMSASSRLAPAAWVGAQAAAAVVLQAALVSKW